jgi:hypothetical protein
MKKYYYFHLSQVTITSDEININRWNDSVYTEISELVYNILNK